MEYPEAVWVPFIPKGTVTREAIADLNALTRSAFASGTVTSIDRCPQTITNVDNFAYNAAADDTDYSETFQWIPEASGKIDKFFVNIATFMHVSVMTGGSVTFNNMTLTITRKGGSDVLFTQAYATGLAARTADEDADLFLVQEAVWGADMRIRAGNPLDIKVTTSVSSVATAVFDTGLVPFYPQQVPSTTGEILFFGHSGLMFYISRDRKT